MSRIARQYDLLEPDERFRLIIAAYARQDEQDARKLLASCPSRHGQQLNLIDELELAREVVLAVLAQLAALTGARELVRALKPAAVHHGFRVSDEAASAAYTASPPDQRDAISKAASKAGAAACERISKPFEQIERELRIEAASFYHGFAAFARKQLALEAATLLAAFAENAPDSWTAFEQEQPNPERVAEHANTLTTFWQWRLDTKTHRLPPDLVRHNP